MGFFTKKSSSGGMMNVIRCDEKEYLVWKWRPNNQELGASKRENGIRYGSSLRVKDGEMAVFVYSKSGGDNQDFIMGPFDETIKTANFPVLSNIVGLAFGGDTPFQAEVYFINLASNVQIFFGVPYFDVFDPRFPDLPVPIAVRGALTFNITDYKGFIKNNRLINFDLKDFKSQIKSAVIKYVKGVVTNIPSDHAIPIVQMERKILEINEIIEKYIAKRFVNDFGVNLKAMDIEAIEVNKSTTEYKELKRLTADITSNTILSQSEVNIQNLKDSQRINTENMEETLRIQREEAQRAQRLQTEQNFIGAHALNKQAEVMKTAAASLGEMGGSIGGGEGGGFNPATMMTGMMMGGALGGQMAGVMNQMGQHMNQTMQQGMQTPPPLPQVSYYVYTNGQQVGPFNMNQLSAMAQSGQLTLDSYVWKQGMAQWDFVKNTELANLFNNQPPVAPPPPPFPPKM